MQASWAHGRGLEIMRKLLSPSCPSCTAAACPPGQPSRSHVHEDCDGLRRRIDVKIERNMRSIMPVQRQAADEADGEVRETSSFLRETGRTAKPNPVNTVVFKDL